MLVRHATEKRKVTSNFKVRSFRIRKVDFTQVINPNTVTLLVHNCIVNAANQVLNSHSGNGTINNSDALVNLLQVFIVLA